MEAPILYPGDYVHMYLPVGYATPEESNRMVSEVEKCYQMKSVTVLVTTTADAPGVPTVVAVFRARPAG